MMQPSYIMFISLFVFVITSLPTVPRIIFCPLQCCPVCHSKAAWNQGSPLLRVQPFGFLTSTPNAPAVHQRSSLHLVLGNIFPRFPPVGPLCSAEDFQEGCLLQDVTDFIMYGRSSAYRGQIFVSYAPRMC